MTNTSADTSVPVEALCRTARRTLAVEAVGDTADLGPDSRLDELGVDSLALAEIMVELEEDLSVLLELRPDARLETIRDLSRALHVIGRLPDRERDAP